MKKATYWIVFTCAAIAVGAYMAREPWGRYQEERALAKKSAQDMQRAENERAQLIEQHAKIKSAAGREELMRENGYIKEGEQPLKTTN